MSDDLGINNTVIVSEDIFMKAAIEYCRRMNIEEPFAYRLNLDGSAAHYFRDELEKLAEKINSLKSVGAI